MKIHHLLLLLWLGTGTAVAQSPTAEKAAFNPPDEATIPANPYGDAIRLGQKLLFQTSLLLKNNSGSASNCTSCHLNGGRQPNAAPWVGIWGVFPEYRTRNARIYSLQDRINDCFERSMNGKALPYNSKEMLGMLAYMHWLSKDVPTGMSVEGRGFIKITAPQAPDSERGKKSTPKNVQPVIKLMDRGNTDRMVKQFFPHFGEINHSILAPAWRD